MKRIISLIFGILGIILLCFGLYFVLTSDKIKTESDKNIITKTPITNESYILSSPHVFEEISLTGLVIQKYENKYTLYANVTNKGNKDIKTKEFTIVLLDKYNSEIKNISTSISDLKAGFSKQLVIQTEVDILNTYDYKVVRK